MSAWDKDILSDDVNIEFLDELADLDPDDIVEAVRDAVLLAANPESAKADEISNGRAAATIAAIWAGAPFSAGDVADAYPFIRSIDADIDETLAEAAISVLENVDTEEDIDQYIEALS
ncbi:DUF4259 domain-containing protein [Corynebacterium qintianiae]|uniref:DUF4259 domain-containing protein n=1 Tax=Corynebacterium qintianiae TaxID=2709392 RepID=UPI0013EB6392|nr:DUF4259 domain-containing protein [Corynebacterium qintianiae]